jgi:hypothetical protein
VPDRADAHTALGQLAVCGFDVGDHQIRGARRPGRRVGQADAELDRAGRARRRELDDPEAGRGVIVDVEGEAGLLGVEGLGPLDIGGSEGEHLQLVVHQAPESG